MNRQKVAMIGCGKLGLPCAEMMAEKHDVSGYDVVPFNSDSVRYFDTIEKTVEGADIIFIAVPTPHDPAYDGKEPTSHLPPKDFDYGIVKSVLTEVNNFVSKEQLVVLISTVLPGTTRREFIDLIPNARFVYNPYLIAMGSVKWDMVNPEMLMIGTEDGSETGDAKQLKDFYYTFMQNNPRCFIGTWDECECLKVFYNTFISAKIGLVNMIQDVAEELGNINSELVCDALAQSTKRIMGPGYMKPGLGDAGACHPRDNIALRHMSEELMLGYDLFAAIMDSREKQAENMAAKMATYAGLNWENWESADPALPVVIVGKAYKPLVPYDAGSSSMLVGHYLERMGATVYYYDEVMKEFPPQDVLDSPAVYLMAHNPEVTYGDQLDFVKDWYAQGHNVTQADEALTVATANGSVLSFAPNSIVIDPWRKIPAMSNVRVVHYGNTRQDALR